MVNFYGYVQNKVNQLDNRIEYLSQPNNSEFKEEVNRLVVLNEKITKWQFLILQNDNNPEYIHQKLGEEIYELSKRLLYVDEIHIIGTKEHLEIDIEKEYLLFLMKGYLNYSTLN